MTSLTRTRLYRVGAVCAFLPATFCGTLAVSLLANVLMEHGSPQGDTFKVAFAALLILISAVSAFFGVFCWKLSKSASQSWIS